MEVALMSENLHSRVDTTIATWWHGTCHDQHQAFSQVSKNMQLATTIHGNKSAILLSMYPLESCSWAED